MWYYPFGDGIIPRGEWSGLSQSVSVNLETTYTIYMFKKVKQNSVEKPEFSVSNFYDQFFNLNNVTFITVESMTET